jgi:hypothetical protein
LRSVFVAVGSEFFAELHADALSIAQHRICVPKKPEFAFAKNVTALLLCALPLCHMWFFLSQSIFLACSETDTPARLAADLRRANSSRVRRRFRITLRLSAFGFGGLPRGMALFVIH